MVDSKKMPPPVTCLICKDIIPSDINFVTCFGGCQSSFHLKCAQLTETLYKNLTQHSLLSWKCLLCRRIEEEESGDKMCLEEHDVDLKKKKIVWPHKVSQRVAMWERRVMEERTSEIFRGLQKKKQEAAKEAEEAEHKQESLWREQERKAKEAEQKIREIARLAREEHKRMSVLDMDTDISKQQPLESPDSNKVEHIELDSTKPPSKDAIVEWFRSSEIARRAGLEADRNVVAPWFHGLITRQEAELLLESQPVGSFLVRVSERIWGYAISYKDKDRCKHYLVDASNGHYQFLGTNQIGHNTLGDLISYHSTQPITVIGGELLGMPCRRTESLPAIFSGLVVRAR